MTDKELLELAAKAALYAFRKEISYKVDITTLEQQRDELLAALEKFPDDNNPDGFGCA